MSWIQDLASFAKRLLTLETRVETNAEEIKSLREDLKALTGFTQKVAYAVKRNEERSQDKQENLILSLKLELAELENRLHASSRTSSLNGSIPSPQALPRSNGKNE